FHATHAPHGPLVFGADEPTTTGYRVLAACPCGAASEWWVSLAEVLGDLEAGYLRRLLAETEPARAAPRETLGRLDQSPVRLLLSARQPDVSTILWTPGTVPTASGREGAFLAHGDLTRSLARVPCRSGPASVSRRPSTHR